MPKRTIVTICMLPLWSVATLEAHKHQPVAKVKTGDLLITGRTTKKPFAANEALSFKLNFKNVGNGPQNLSITEYLGSQTVGRYQVKVRNTKTNDLWQVGRDPTAILPGAPARLRIVKLKPGQSRTTKFIEPLIGQRFWHGGTEKQPKKVTRRLPQGNYKIMIQVKKAEMPIPFRVGK